MWPADKIERRALASLVPYARNARTHSDSQVAQLAASITQFGWTMPVLVDEAGGIIAGHGRVLAGNLLGYTDAPVMVAVGWSEAKKRAYVLADNKLALNAGWDADMLGLELADLQADGADIQMLGFTDEELLDLLPKQAGLMDPMDGASQTRSDNGAALVWGKNRIPLTAEEAAFLDRRLAAHESAFGVAFGFVREAIAGGDLSS